jgi:hypothetical protein
VGGHWEAPGTILAPPKVNKSPLGIHGKIRGTLDFTASGRILTGHRPARDSKQPSRFPAQTAATFQGSAKPDPERRISACRRVRRGPGCGQPHHRPGLLPHRTDRHQLPGPSTGAEPAPQSVPDSAAPSGRLDRLSAFQAATACSSPAHGHESAGDPTRIRCPAPPTESTPPGTMGVLRTRLEHVAWPECSHAAHAGRPEPATRLSVPPSGNESQDTS